MKKHSKAAKTAKGRVVAKPTVPAKAVPAKATTAKAVPAKHRTAKQVAEAHARAEKAAKTRHAHELAAKKLGAHKKVAKWSPGLDVACCAAEALAASARLAGLEVSDADVLALYWRTADDPDAGATLAATIEAAGAYGIGGARLVAARPATALHTGIVLGVDLAERHALTVDGHGVWTWGEWRPAACGLLAAADEAWALTWGAA